MARLLISSALRYLELVRQGLAGPGGRLSARRIALMLLFLPLLAVVQLIHWIGLALDAVLFPGYRKVEIRDPVFVVGVPRSGTTFVHRVMARDDQFTTFSTWECLFALSVTARRFWSALAALDRRVGRPLSRLLRRLESRLTGALQDVHATGLAAPEEDYFALMPVLACFILVVPFPRAESVWRMGFFDRDVPAKERRRLMAFYRSCLQRHLYFHGPDKRLLSKNASFAPLIGSLRETFPDARVICCMRDPAETLPSQLSSLESGMRLFGNDPRDPLFRERMLAMMEFYYANLLEHLQHAPRDRAVLVSMDRLKQDLDSTLTALYGRLGIALAPEFADVLSQEALRARSYATRHHYRLSDFRLDPQGIRGRFAHVYDRFAFPSGESPAQAPAQGASGGPRGAELRC